MAGKKRSKKNYGVAPLLAGMPLVWMILIGAIFLMFLPIIIKVWAFVFTKPTVGSIPSWAIVVAIIVVAVLLRNKRRTGSYV